MVSNQKDPGSTPHDSGVKSLKTKNLQSAKTAVTSARTNKKGSLGTTGGSPALIISEFGRRKPGSKLAKHRLNRPQSRNNNASSTLIPHMNRSFLKTQSVKKMRNRSSRKINMTASMRHSDHSTLLNKYSRQSPTKSISSLRNKEGSLS